MGEDTVSARSKHTILCVDDDVTSLHLRRTILEREGYTVIAVDRPVKALQQDLHRIDVAVLDYDMPEMNGRNLLLKMRAARATCPIVLVSGCVSLLPWESRVLFSACIEKCRPIGDLLQIIEAYRKQAAVKDFW